MEARNLYAAILHLSRDIFYYSGTAQPGWLVVRPDRAVLFVRSGLSFAQRQSGLAQDQIVQQSKLGDICEKMFGSSQKDLAIGLELDVMPVPMYRQFQKILPNAVLTDISGDILAQRSIKDDEEISAIRKATDALHAGHMAALNHWQPGMTELDASAVVEDGQRRAGHEGVYFIRQPDFTMGRGPFASGENIGEISGVVFTVSGTGLSAAVPAGASRRPLQKGDLVIADIPTCVDGYHGDQTRTYSLGQPGKSALEAHNCLLGVSDALIAGIKPGQTAGEVFDLAQTFAEQMGLEERFLRFPGGNQAHFVGHGVGLELNEPPFLARGSQELIRENMVLAIELHCCDHEAGIVKLEDMIQVTQDGGVLLTQSPRELAVIE